MESKKNNGLIVFLIILLLGVSTIGLLLFTGVIKSPMVKCDCECNKEEKKETKKKTTNYVINNQNYKDFDVPYINIDTEEISKVNIDIESFSTKYVNSECIKNNVCGIDYTYSVNDNILSVFIQTYYNFNYYYGVSIDLDTDKVLTNTEIIKKKNLTESELKEKLFKVYENNILTNIDMFKSTNAVSKDISAYDATRNEINDTNIEDFQMYLNSNNELIVTNLEYTIAGAGYITRIVNIDKIKYEDSKGLFK